MKLDTALQNYNTILFSGPLGTRLKYQYGLTSPASKVILEPKGRAAVSELLRGDIDVAQENNIPIIINAPTFRASKNHLHAEGFTKSDDVRKINLECIDLVNEIRSSYKDPRTPIIIDAPLGSMYDAYTVEPTLNIQAAKEYHRQQLNIFSELEIDFVNAVTISSLVEALAISLVAKVYGLTHTIGFILNTKTTLLDGTPLHEAIRIIDEETNLAPLGYLITCTHASIISKLQASKKEYNRLIGILANGTQLPLNELTTLTTAIADDPEKFAEDLKKIKEDFNLKLLGGCCGTSREHLRALANIFK